MRKTTKQKSIHQGSFQLVCPVHKTEQIYRMYFNMTVKVSRMANGRDLQGKHVTTNWFFCNKCGKAYQVKYTVAK